MSDGGLAVIGIIVVILAVCLIVAIVKQAVRAALAVGVLFFVVPVLCTVLWGNGTQYIARFASIFTPDIENSINNGYQFYLDNYMEDPIVDLQQIEDYAGQAVDAVSDTVSGVLTSDRIKDVIDSGKVFGNGLLETGTDAVERVTDYVGDNEVFVQPFPWFNGG